MTTIAISAIAPGIQSVVDPRFGRAKYFVLVEDVDTAGSSAQALDNSTSAAAPSGAGVSTVQTLANAGVGIVITGRVGPKATDALRHAGIQVFEDATGTVAEALAAYHAHTLPQQGAS